MTGEWKAGEIAALGSTLESFGRRTAELVLDVSRNAQPGVQPAMTNSLRGLEAASAQVYAIGALLQLIPVPVAAVVSLTRSAVESMGRAWRVISSDDEDARNRIAIDLRVREIDRARFKGFQLFRKSGGEIDDVLAAMNPERNERYAETAVAVLRETGLSEEEANRFYSALSGVAHGESLSIEGLRGRVDGDWVYMLTKSRAEEYVLTLFLGMNHTLGRFVDLFAPARLSELKAISSDSQAVLGAIFEK